jgi:CcmD family protein
VITSSFYLFAQAAQPSPTTSEQRSTSFRSVQGGEALQSGEKLLVEAYAVIWVLVFAMVFFSWRRQRKIDERIAGLEQAVAAARRSAAKPEVKASKEPAASAEKGDA